MRVYGLGARPPVGKLSFHAVQTARFLEDLASCSGLISTAGNQLVGEALYLGKPVLVMPETLNYEQHINARFVSAMGVGASVNMERITPTQVRSFLQQSDHHRSCIDRGRVNGLPAALAALRRHLNLHAHAPRPEVAAAAQLPSAL